MAVLHARVSSDREDADHSVAVQFRAWLGFGPLLERRRATERVIEKAGERLLTEEAIHQTDDASSGGDELPGVSAGRDVFRVESPHL